MVESEIDQVAQSKDVPPAARTEDPAKAAFDAKVAELRARDGGGDSTDFSDALEADGVKAKVKTKGESGKSATQAAATDTEGDTDKSVVIADDGTDALLDAVAPDTKGANRQDHMQKRGDLQKRAEEAGLPPEIARALAGNVKAEIAEKWLESHVAGVQSPSAGQTDKPASDVPVGATAAASASEVKRLLGEELGEETATAVAGVIANLEARVERAERMAEQTLDATTVTVRAQAKTALDQATGEVSGQFPDLVRDGVLNSNVGQMAAAFIKDGVFPREDLKGALEAACRAHFGGTVDSSSSRQQSRQTQPDLGAPSTGRESLPGRPLTQTEVQTRLTQVAHKHREDPNRGALLKKAAAKMAAHNERQRQKR